VKIALSERESASAEFVADGRSLSLAWTRADFEAVIAPLLERTLVPCRQALRDAGLQPADLAAVVLVGGSTRVPSVRRRVAELFGREPLCTLNPDEVVALGAAVQADILTSGRRDQLLLDVTPLSLGIETVGGVVSKIIHRNSPIPASASDEFTTSVDDQTGVVIHVLQGERELVQDCRSLGRFVIPVQPLPAGLARVKVSFQIDASVILHVTAEDVRTGREQTVDVRPSYGLTDAEVEDMLMAAFDHAESDVEHRQYLDACTEAEQVIAATERTLRGPAGGRLDDDEREEIAGELASVRAAMATQHAEPVRQALARLNEATMHLAELAMAAALDTAAHDPRALQAIASSAPDPASFKPKH
jgi:molecular chaperone DnaK (HSP70)